MCPPFSRDHTSSLYPNYHEDKDVLLAIHHTFSKMVLYPLDMVIVSRKVTHLYDSDAKSRPIATLIASVPDSYTLEKGIRNDVNERSHITGLILMSKFYV